MEESDYVVKNLYQPGFNSFNLESKNLPAHNLEMEGMMKASEMGITINPMVADQLGELSRALNQGVVPVEVGTLDMKNFDTVPTEHWDEMRRKAELAGSRLTMHAPLIDPAGFSSGGGGQARWDETNQKLAEMQLKDVFDKASQITSKKTGVATPVTIHAGNYPGSTYKIDPVTGKKVIEQLIAVNRDTGEIAPMKEEVKYYAGRGEGGGVEVAISTPEDQLKAINRTQWNDSLSKVEYQRENAVRIMKDVHAISKGIYQDIASGKKVDHQMSKMESEEIKKLYSASEYVNDAQRDIQSVFNKAYTIAKKDKDKDRIEELNNISKNFSERLGHKKDEKTGEFHATSLSVNPQVQSDAVFGMMQDLKGIGAPNTFVKVEDFAIKKASETLTNVALHSYDNSKKTGVEAPQISLENLYSGMAFSQGEDLAKMTQETRDKFTVKLVEERNMSRGEAAKVAEKMIGVTFDVGHLNMSRSKGFTEADLVKEAEAVKDYINKVHLTDNFGYEDVHLPVGMGNVPVKALMKAIGKKGAEAVKINEVGGWINAFKTSPFPQLLQAAGSPIYGTGSGPTWAQSSGFQQSYSSGFGQMLPDTHYGLFGAGFSQLPAELGGSLQGSRGRD